MLPLNFIFIAGKETAVGENIISIVNRCFLILIKEVEKYLQVFLSRTYCCTCWLIAALNTADFHGSYRV